MKRFTLWFAIALVLFSFSGGFAKEESLPADLADLLPFQDTIFYDKYDPDSIPFGHSLVGPEDYWIGVLFIVPPSYGFTVGGAEFKVNNELINTTDTAHLYLVKNIFVGNSPRPDWSNVIDVETVTAPFNRLQGKPFSSFPVVAGDYFWIVLGPVPGGPDTDSAEQGWWAFSDDSINTIHSYASFGDSISWELRPADSGNFVIRARGNFSPPPEVVINEVMFNADTSSSDPARNHEWIELYNQGGIQTTNLWQLRDERSETINITGPTGGAVSFPGGYYLVVHLGVPGHTDGELDSSGNRINLYKTYTDNRGFFDDQKGACVLDVGVPPYLSYMGWNLKNLALNPNPINPDTFQGSPSGALELGFGGLEKAFPLRAKRIQPTQGVGPLLTGTAGISVGLDSQSDTTADLDLSFEASPPFKKAVTFLGGPNAAGPTMGRKNLLPMDFDTLISDIVTQPGSWMIMLYMAGDYGDSLRSPDRWYYDVLNQIETALPAAPRNVNVAVLYDTRRGRIGGEAISGAMGATFKGTLRNDGTDTVRNLRYTPSENTGDSSTLSGFIQGVKNTLPSADHYVLALKGNGAGWEGLCGDFGSGDRLEMGELKSALRQAGLDTAKLDLIIFDAPLMSQLEVATQVKDFAHFMVASPEMTGPADVGYAHLVEKLIAEPAISNENLADFVVGDLDERLKQDAFAVWTATNLDGLNPLLSWLNILALNLEAGVIDRCSPGYALDNYQLKIRERLVRISTDHYGTQAQGMADFVDLRRLVSALKDPPYPSTCTPGHNTGTAEIENLLTLGGSIIAALGGGGTKGSGYHSSGPPAGLSIYFPSSRQKDVPINGNHKNFGLGPYTSRSDHPFDTTGLVLEGGVFGARYIYAADSGACYPHDGGACDTGSTNDSARNYPYPPAPNFAFTDDTRWDEFLVRYYKPVADAESTFYAKSLSQVFNLKGTGTSDPDSDSLTYFWDLDAREDADALCGSFELEDLDKNCFNNDSTDDGDLKGGQTVSFSGFSTAGHHALWLNVWDDYHLFSSSPRFQTSRITDTVVVQIEFKKVKIAFEDDDVDGIYFSTKATLDPPVGDDPVDLRTPGSRDAIPPNRLTSNPDYPLVLWSTGDLSLHTFPPACQTALDNAMANDSQGVWICGQRLGVDKDTAALYLKNKWGFTIDSTKTLAGFVTPSPLLQHFLQDLDTLRLYEGTYLERLSDLRCPAFPLLVDSSGNVVAAARVVTENQRAIIFSTFGLEHIAEFSRRKDLLIRVLSWLIRPTAPDAPTLGCLKGDVNRDCSLSPADVALGLELIYVGTGNGDSCGADVASECGILTSSDAVQLGNMVFLGEPSACSVLFREAAFETVESKPQIIVEGVEER